MIIMNKCKICQYEWKSKTIIGVKGHIPKILVVDDSQVHCSILSNFLTSLGIKNKSANNGEEGLVIAREFQPDLIITDLLMSGMDGWKMMEIIRTLPEFSQTKIMISSASNPVISFEKMRQYNCIDFIPKPINFDLFINQLQLHLSLQWLYEDESYFAPKLSTIPLVCNAVREGDIREIIYQANQLKMAKTEYTDWANYIIRLAENFQIEKIQDIFNYELS
jgi:CheY-like chemotaxis protein